jgi:hypothetical protein
MDVTIAQPATLRRDGEVESTAAVEFRHVSLRDGIQIVSADPTKADNAEFMVLHNGRIHVEGTAGALLAEPDSYLREFLFKTLPPW